MSRLRLFATIIFGLLALPVGAIDIGPEDAISPRVGLSSVQVGVSSSQRDDLFRQGQKLSSETEYNTHQQHIRLAHSFDWGGRPSIVYVQLPYLDIETKNIELRNANGRVIQGTQAVDSRPGWGDTALLLATWLQTDREHGRHLALAGYLFLPTGSYDIDNTVAVNTNPGGNRYRVALQLAHHWQLSPRVGWMAAFDTLWYGKNTKAYWMNGTLSFSRSIPSAFTPERTTRRQAPLYSLQTALSYRVAPELSVGASYFYSVGGETSLGGVSQKDRLRSHRYQLTTNYFLRPTTRLTVQYGNDLKIENGFRESRLINVNITQLF